MGEDLETAHRYREHAEELRVIAADASPQIQKNLLGIADDYERMADTLEAVDRTNRALYARLKADRATIKNFTSK